MGTNHANDAASAQRGEPSMGVQTVGYRAADDRRHRMRRWQPVRCRESR